MDTIKPIAPDEKRTAGSLPRDCSVPVSHVIRTDRIMWKLIRGIRRARIAKNQTRLAHLEARYARFERKGWVALP